MEINQFNKLTLKIGEFIKIQFTNGNTLNGSYIGNFDNSSLEFDVSNHATGGCVLMMLMLLIGCCEILI